MVKKILNFLKRLNQLSYLEQKQKVFLDDESDMKKTKLLLGRMMANMNAQRKGINSLEEVEFQVYSQWGDDGIIQYLISKLEIPHKTFVEFGVENYRESNTRFLLINNNWSGLVIDGSEKNIDFVKKDILSWGYELFSTCAFITKDNINELISTNFLKKGYNPEVGLLSIDIDGNDYWVWEKIDVVNPIIVVVEYNSLFGSDNYWTIPYAEDFVRIHAHTSKLYYGASFAALYELGQKKGYSFIGCNSSGNNMYFIRNDKLGEFKGLSIKEGYIASKFREYSLDNGIRPSGKERLEVIKGMRVFNIKNNQIEMI
jgi:hypothetical protein